MILTLLALTMAADPCGSSTRESVEWRACWIADADLSALARQESLRRLDLSMTRITDQGLLYLKNLPALEELNLRYAELVTDEGMSAVKSWKRLRRIDLRGSKITDTTLGYLGGIPTLESIDAGFTQVTDHGIELLTTLPALKRLTIGGNKLTDMGMQALRLMPSLEYLDVSGPQRTDSGLWSVSLTDSGLAAIATLANLRELRLGGVNVSAGSLEQLCKSMPKLERLSLFRCKRVTDEAVAALAGWKSLRELDVAETKLTPAGIARLRAALSGCVIRD